MTDEVINQNGKKIEMWRHADDYEWQRDFQNNVETGKVSITCGHCPGQMHLRALDSDTIGFHAAHNQKSGDDNCVNRGSGGESKQHQIAKQRVAEMIQSDDIKQITTEQWLTMGQRKKRKADLFVVYNDGTKVVHEIQFGNQTSTSTERRDKDYYDNEVDQIVWWWGEPARYSGTFRLGNREYCIQNHEQFGLIDVVQEEYMGRSIIKDVKAILYDTQEIIKERKAKEEKERQEWQARQDELKRLQDEREKQLRIKRERQSVERRASVEKLQSVEKLRYEEESLTEREKIHAKKQQNHIARVVNIAERKRHISLRYTTEFKNGYATLIAYNKYHDAFKSESGLWWRLSNDLLVSYTGLRPIDGELTK